MALSFRRILIIAVVLALLLAATAFLLTRTTNAELGVPAISGATPQIVKADKETIPTIKIAKPIGWGGNAMPIPAPGLGVRAFATGLDHPRWLLQLSNGDVLVAESNSPPRKPSGIVKRIMGLLMSRAGAGVPSANRITLLRDTDSDGVADQRSVFLKGLNSPFGMAEVGDRIYVGDTDALLAFPYSIGDTAITASPEKIIDLPGGGNHWARNVVATPDGKRLYVTVGSSSNIAENGLDAEVNRAAILEVDPASKQFRIYASGLRNPNGMAYQPTTGALWTVVNERDMIGGDGPPDYLAMVDFGAFYGWPYSYWGGYVDKRVQPDRPDLLEYTRRPDYALGPHTASLGLAFTNGAALGPKFANGAVIGQHGSWNRNPVSGYKVVYVPFDAVGRPVKGSVPVDLLTGFLDKDGRAQGRPVGVIVDKSGALLVADDVGNRIWRVSAR